VYQALQEAGIEPDWIIGTSVGVINASPIAGNERNKSEVTELRGYGSQSRTHVVQLLAPRLDPEDNSKDIDFSQAGIKQGCEAGYARTEAVLARKPRG
jgi:NTE family protein